MASSDRQQETVAAVAQRWLADTLATYSEAASKAFQSQPDPFANPVGHAVRTGTLAAVEALAAGRSAEDVAACLDEIIQIRAVQEFEPSAAIGFVFLLKDAIREKGSELFSRPSPEEKSSDPFSLLIDRVALAAFDIYMRYRRRICELRINEVKRSVGR